MSFLKQSSGMFDRTSDLLGNSSLGGNLIALPRSPDNGREFLSEADDVIPRRYFFFSGASPFGLRSLHDNLPDNLFRRHAFEEKHEDVTVFSIILAGCRSGAIVREGARAPAWRKP